MGGDCIPACLGSAHGNHAIPFAATGSKRAYLISLVAFTLGSALCGFAWNLPVLIFFRVLQGLGGAILFPLTLAFFFTIFPPAERGTAMAVMGIPSLVVPALGPVVGGYLITVASWRVIFFINVPIGIVAILLGMVVLREARTAGAVRFDLPGFLTSAYGLAAVLYAFSQASANGWTSPSVLALLSSGGLALVAFVAIELVTIHRGGRAIDRPAPLYESDLLGWECSFGGDCCESV